MKYKSEDGKPISIWSQKATGNYLPPFDDGIFTKSNHRVILMMEKIKKHIIYSAEDKALNIDQKDIEQYLSEVKDAVEKDNYRLDRNAKRQENFLPPYDTIFHNADLRPQPK